YVGMGNRPHMVTDPTGGHTETDFVNSLTGERLYINDGLDQVLEVSDLYWSSLQELSVSPTWSQHQTNLYESILSVGTLRPDLFSTISNVLEGQTFISISGDCEDAARAQCNNAGVQPQWKYGGIHMLVDNQLQRARKGQALTEDRSGALSVINNELLMGNPVMIGVSYGGGRAGRPDNTNKLVGHFVVINGRGSDINGNYFTYWDNVRSYGGTNTFLNRFYLQPNSTLVNPRSPNFIVTDVRPNIR
ncbi:MAG: hypothetical protein AAFY76_12200, partial [Cyanobacteria bacterium J06649_11]